MCIRDSSQTVRTLFILSGNFPDYPETFQSFRTLSRLYRNFPDHPETSQCNFKGYAQKNFWTRKNFPDGTMPRWFLRLWCTAQWNIAFDTQNALFIVNSLHWHWLLFFLAFIVDSGRFWSRKEVTTFREGEEGFSGGFNWQRQRNLLWQEIRGKKNNT